MKTKGPSRHTVLEAVVRICSEFSIMPKRRLRALGIEALSIADIQGDIAELGCYWGGSAMLLATLAPQKLVHAFDSLTGLDNLGPEDKLRNRPGERGHIVGDFALPLKEQFRVRGRLRSYGIHFHSGPFCRSKWALASTQFSFAHFDGDTYRSAVEFLEFFFPRLTIGGKLMFDDFQWPATPGVAKAVRQLVSRPDARSFQPTRYQLVIEKLLL